MPSTFANLVRTSVTAAPGTGTTISLGAAVLGFLTPALAGLPDGVQVSYALEDAGSFEVGRATYSAAGNQLIGRTLVKSTTGALLNASASAEVSIVILAEDMNEKANAADPWLLGPIKHHTGVWSQLVSGPAFMTQNYTDTVGPALTVTRRLISAAVMRDNNTGTGAIVLKTKPMTGHENHELHLTGYHNGIGALDATVSWVRASTSPATFTIPKVSHRGSWRPLIRLANEAAAGNTAVVIIGDVADVGTGIHLNVDAQVSSTQATVDGVTGWQFIRAVTSLAAYSSITTPSYESGTRGVFTVDNGYVKMTDAVGQRAEYGPIDLYAFNADGTPREFGVNTHARTWFREAAALKRLEVGGLETPAQDDGGRAVMWYQGLTTGNVGDPVINFNWLNPSTGALGNIRGQIQNMKVSGTLESTYFYGNRGGSASWLPIYLITEHTTMDLAIGFQTPLGTNYLGVYDNKLRFSPTGYRPNNTAQSHEVILGATDQVINGIKDFQSRPMFQGDQITIIQKVGGVSTGVDYTVNSTTFVTASDDMVVTPSNTAFDLAVWLNISGYIVPASGNSRDDHTYELRVVRRNADGSLWALRNVVAGVDNDTILSGPTVVFSHTLVPFLMNNAASQRLNGNWTFFIQARNRYGLHTIVIQEVEAVYMEYLQ